MSGPIRRLRAATKVPSPKATVQTIVANDADRQVAAVRLSIKAVGKVKMAPIEVDLSLSRHKKKTGDSYFAATVDCGLDPSGLPLKAVAQMLDANGKPIGEAQTFSFEVESYDELTDLVDARLDGVSSNHLVRRSVALLRASLQDA